MVICLKFAKFTRTIIGETVSSIGRAPELYSEGYEFDSRTDSLAFCFTQINRKVWIRVNNLLQHAQHFYKKNASTILSCVGGAGVVVTTITAIKATPKALKSLDEAKKEKGEGLTTVEKIKIAGPKYIPTILIGTGTVACIFGANVLNKRSQAALVSAYTLVDSSFKEYKQKLKELYGEETHNNVVDAMAVEKVDRDWSVSGSYFGQSCDLANEEACGDPVLFYEENSGRYFESTIEQVLNSMYHLNRNHVLRGYVYLNEYYEFLGLEQTDYGSVMGWAPNDDGEFWIEFNVRKTVLDDGLEIYILETPFEPTYEPWNY